MSEREGLQVVGVYVHDQDEALAFYTEKLGFVKKHDIDLGGGARWLTVVSPAEPDGAEVLLEPNAEYPAMKTLKADLKRDGIPFTAFQVDDVYGEYERMQALGVEFTMEPTNMGTTSIAILDDTCGNLIQIYQMMG